MVKAVFGSCKSISGKYSIFRKCYFPERKIFLCVWLHFKKFSGKYFLVFGKEEGKDKPRKKIINDRRSTGFDGAVLRELQSDDLTVDRDPRSRFREGEIAIDGAISRWRDLDFREITINGAIS